MANIKVSNMPEATNLEDEDLLMIVQSGTNKKIKSSYVTTSNKNILTIDTTQEMIASRNLKNGQKIRTLGYYDINDGGGALFYITNLYSANEYQIQTQTSGLYANLEPINNTINIKHVGAKGNGSVDDTNAIQSAIDYCVSKKMKLFIPEGNFAITDTLTISGDIDISGNGSESIIKLNANITDQKYMMEIKNVGFATCVRNIKFSGSGNTCKAAIGIAGANTTLRDIVVYNIGGNGIETIYGSFKVNLDNVSIRRCTGYGLYVGNTDSYFNNMDVYYTKKHGYYIAGTGGSNNKFVNCKAYFIGFLTLQEMSVVVPEADGWYLDGLNAKANTNHFVNCESQECGRNGWTINNVIGCQFSNCFSDSGNVFNDGGIGVNIINSSFLNANFNITNKIGLRGVYGKGLVISGTNNSIINSNINTIYTTASETITSYTDMYVLDYNPSNEITINGNYIEPDYKNSLATGNTVATDMTSANAGDMTATYIIDKAQRAQKISISQPYTNANSWVAITKQLDVYNATKLGVSLEAKASISTGIFQSVRVEFYNAQQTRISYLDNTILPNNYPKSDLKIRLNWMDYSHIFDIPENTVSVKVYLRAISTTANSTGDFWFRHLKVTSC